MPIQTRQSAAAEIFETMNAILADGIEDEQDRRFAESLRDFCERRLQSQQVAKAA